MIVLVPMGGLGTRFSRQGYALSKPAIPVYDRHTGLLMPMVIAAMKDMQRIGGPATRFICIDQVGHQASGLEAEIRSHFPQVQFIHDHARLGQAFACLLARELLQSGEELIVASCDAGIEADVTAFRQRTAEADALMFSHSNDQNIESNPLAHSWAELNEDGESIRRISIKQPVSSQPMSDHATTGVFWFRRAADFLARLEAVIFGRGGPPTDCLVDHVLQRYAEEGARVSFLDVRYYCWGTAQDYEAYQQTYAYWGEYLDANAWLKTGTLNHRAVPEREAEHSGTDAAAARRRAARGC